MKKFFIVLLTLLCAGTMFTACSSETDAASSVMPSSDDIVQTKNEIATPSLQGKSLFIYCGAGMKKPFSEITDAFEEQTGAAVQVTYGNAAQIISQIKASEEGDLFVAGDQNDLASIQDEYVSGIKPLVKHIPVIAVAAGNPKNIQTLSDLAKSGITVVLGDNKATPIGKISDKALSNAGILDKVDVAARLTTAPEIANALSLGQCDAVIVWKENTNIDGVEALDSTGLEDYVKRIPAATLKTGTNTETRDAFLSFLDSSAATKIWTDHGYELLT